jgi:hypothetical protein
MLSFNSSKTDCHEHCSDCYYRLLCPNCSFELSGAYVNSCLHRHLFYSNFWRVFHHQPTTVRCWTEASPIARHLVQSSATCIHLPPSVLYKSSLHLAIGRPTLLLPYAVSTPELVYPNDSEVAFSMLIRCAMSVTLVLYRVTWFQIPSRRETPSIVLSIARWAVPTPHYEIKKFRN